VTPEISWSLLVTLIVFAVAIALIVRAVRKFRR
jgi:hypothetical protein